MTNEARSYDFTCFSGAIYYNLLNWCVDISVGDFYELFHVLLVQI